MSEHITHEMHEHSLEGYAEERDSGRLDQRCRLIKGILEGALYFGMSDREIMHKLGYSDPNKVRPRITEMLKAGELIECEPMLDRETGKLCRRVRLQARQERLF